MSTHPGESSISGGQLNEARQSSWRSPQNREVAGAVSRPRHGGENRSSMAVVRSASGLELTTRR
jgi:hypothetical protein